MDIAEGFHLLKDGTPGVRSGRRSPTCSSQALEGQTESARRKAATNSVPLIGFGRTATTFSVSRGSRA
jgi:hypothetical protein